jgi:hypothetical protein
LAAKVKELGYKPIVDFVCGEIYFKNVAQRLTVLSPNMEN